MGMFDPESFLGTQTKESNSTVMIPVPEGEYNAVVVSVAARQINDKVILDVVWKIDSAEVAAATGREENSVRQSIFLDMTSNGGLDFSKGKNVGLGRLREALGQNKDGKPWSPRNMEGQVARVLVTHRIDKNDDSIVYADVKRVASL